MKKKRVLFASVTASVAAALFAPLAVRAAAGPTCTVAASGADYTTIQAAVNDTNCATVKVAKGNYVGDVVVTRNVYLKGAKAGENVKYRTFAGVNEATITGKVTIQAANVTLNGFSLTNPGQGQGVVVKTAGNNADIKNNIMSVVGDVAFPDNATGIYLEYGPDNVSVSDNKVMNIKSVKSAQGIYIGDSTSNDPSLGVRITGNTVSDITSTKGAYGIEANNGASSAAKGYTTLKVRNNTVKNLTGGWVHAIGLEGDTPNAVVTGNTVSGLNSAGVDKIAVFFEDNVFFFTADVSRNSLDVGAGAGGIVVNPNLTNLYPSLSLDGACNWWGSKSGPSGVGGGTGSVVSAGVDYAPWLKSSNTNGSCGYNKWHDDSDNRHWYHHDD